jgi:hypothetical protein
VRSLLGLISGSAAILDRCLGSWLSSQPCFNHYLTCQSSSSPYFHRISSPSAVVGLIAIRSPL